MICEECAMEHNLHNHLTSFKFGQLGLITAHRWKTALFGWFRCRCTPFIDWIEFRVRRHEQREIAPTYAGITITYAHNVVKLHCLVRWRRSSSPPSPPIVGNISPPPTANHFSIHTTQPYCTTTPTTTTIVRLHITCSIKIPVSGLWKLTVVVLAKRARDKWAGDASHSDHTQHKTVSEHERFCGTKQHSERFESSRTFRAASQQSNKQNRFDTHSRTCDKIQLNSIRMAGCLAYTTGFALHTTRTHIHIAFRMAASNTAQHRILASNVAALLFSVHFRNERERALCASFIVCNRMCILYSE